MEKKRIIHYINQFYAQIGGEEKADIPPFVKAGPVGPGILMNDLLRETAEIAATIVCGDSYFAENQEAVLEYIANELEKYNPDGFILGPAFNAGRYGLACGAVGSMAREKMGIPVVTGMFHENPGAEMYAKDIYIISTTSNAASMRNAVPAMCSLLTKLLLNEEIGFPEDERYLPQGYRVNVWKDKCGAERGIDMLLQKIKGEPFTTELPMPVFDRVEPAPAIMDLKSAKIALVTSGGIVPAGNPDRIESANASKYGSYDISSINDLNGKAFITVHGGYDPVYALEDPDRVLPLDAMRLLEKEKLFSSLDKYFYSTVGNTTAVSSAKKYGEAIAERLLADGVNGVILTST